MASNLEFHRGDRDLFRLLTGGSEWCAECQGRHSSRKRSQPAETSTTI